MYSSKSIFFTRNNQLIKQSQSDVYFVDKEGNRVSQPSIFTENNKSVYYTSDGSVKDAVSNAVTRKDTGVESKAKSKASLTATKAPAANTDSLEYKNEQRKKYGLPPYPSIQKMLSGEAELKQEYDSAMRSYKVKYPGVGEAEFKKYYPDVYAFAADMNKSNPNSITKEDFSDNEIFEAIKTHNEEELNKINPSDIVRVLSGFIKSLKNFDSRRERWELYEDNLRSNVLPQYQFQNKLMVNYIVKQKKNQAGAIDYSRQQSMTRSQAAKAQQQQSRAFKNQVQVPGQPRIRELN